MGGAGQPPPQSVDALIAPVRNALISLPIHVTDDIRRLQLDRPGTQFHQDKMDALNEHGPNGPWRQQDVIDVLNIAIFSLAAVANNAYSVGRLVIAPVSMLSIQILVRTILESSSRIWWLLQSDITCRERVTRGVVDTVDGFYEDLRPMTKSNDHVLEQNANYWVGASLDWAQRLGLPLKADKRGRKRIEGYTRPNSSELIQEFLTVIGFPRGATLYGYLSAATHGFHYHMIDRDGPQQKATINTVNDLRRILPLAIRPIQEVHVILAEYLGGKSAARSAPYVKILRDLEKYTKVDLSSPIGIL